MDAAIVGALNFDESFGELERGLDRIVEAAAIFRAYYQPIDDDRDRVVHPPIQLRRVRDLDQISIDDRAHESLLARGVEQLAKLSFAAAYERREDLDLAALGPGENRIRDLSGALTLDGAAAIGAMRGSSASVEKSQVVVDLGDRPNGRSRVVSGALLLDRNRGRKTLDRVDIRLLH